MQSLIHPYSTFRFLWDLMMILLILIIVYTFPIFLAFPAFDFYSPFGHESSCGHRYTAMTVNIVTDVIFATDILLNFRTGIVENEAENLIIMDAKKIRKAYLRWVLKEIKEENNIFRGWFTIDLISTVPVSIIWEAIGGASQSDLGVMKVAKLFQLLRLIRLTKVFRTKHQVPFFQRDSFTRFLVERNWTLSKRYSHNCSQVAWRRCHHFDFLPFVSLLPVFGAATSRHSTWHLDCF